MFDLADTTERSKALEHLAALAPILNAVVSKVHKKLESTIWLRSLTTKGAEKRRTIGSTSKKRSDKTDKDRRDDDVEGDDDDDGDESGDGKARSPPAPNKKRKKEASAGVKPPSEAPTRSAKRLPPTFPQVSAALAGIVDVPLDMQPRRTLFDDGTPREDPVRALKFVWFILLVCLSYCSLVFALRIRVLLRTRGSGGAFTTLQKSWSL